MPVVSETIAAIGFASGASGSTATQQRHSPAAIGWTQQDRDDDESAFASETDTNPDSAHTIPAIAKKAIRGRPGCRRVG